MRIVWMLPFALISLVGCGGPTIDGKYSMTGEGTPPGGKIVMDLKAGKFTQTMDVEQMGMKIHADTTGTYTFDGKKIKMTVTDIKVDDANLPAQVKEMIKGQIEQTKSKTQESDVKIEGEVVTLTSEGKTATLTKIK
ncbi:MAG: hypothetical protein WCI55_08175 [Armatimonadota bacterium]